MNKINKIRHWPFVFDCKIIGILLAVSVFVTFIAPLLFYINKMWFYPTITPKGILRSNVFYFYDFLIPLCFFFVILYLFSPCFGKKGGAFFYSLPLQRINLHFVRWLRVVFVLFIPYTISCLLTNIQLNSLLEKKSQLDYIFIFTISNSVFLCGVGFLLITILKKLFYVASLIGGFILIDISTSGTLFGEWSLFINSSSITYTKEVYQNNRIFYLILGILSVVICCIIFCSRYYRNKL